MKADPRFALGYAELGEACRLKFSLDKDTKWIDEALANCQESGGVGRPAAGGYVTLGHVHRATGKYDLALQEYQRALQLDPRSAEAEIGLAHSYDSARRTAGITEAGSRRGDWLRPDPGAVITR